MAENEFGLIRKFAGLTPRAGRLKAGIGDDAAVITSGRKGFYELFTCDALVEGVHFTAGDKLSEVGYKSVAVSVSDIAAMGGLPAEAVVAVGVPGRISATGAINIYKGMLKAAKMFGLNLAGGDTVKSKELFISVAMTGFVEKGRLALRKGAKAGDAIMVTGRLGGSLENGKHLSFRPRLLEARYLTKRFAIHSMIDISDGLAGDLRRICEMSGCGAVIYRDKVPVSKTLKKYGEEKSFCRAMTDGEDFELLFTVPPGAAESVAKGMEKKFNLEAAEIGRITKDKNILLEKDEKTAALNMDGYRHF
ncbi:MAG: thiamine-phosphate kinase [Candidatus Aureabacteria bacterium]|nr:thiamine-phosphate kinase [Candidatus Auribacterota bacterium]